MGTSILTNRQYTWRAITYGVFVLQKNHYINNVMGLIFVIHEENMLTKMDFEGEEKKTP